MRIDLIKAVIYVDYKMCSAVFFSGRTVTQAPYLLMRSAVGDKRVPL